MKPKKKINGITFLPVPKFSGSSFAFGADESEFFKRREIPNIPAEYIDMAESLFFEGGHITRLNKDVDAKLAKRAIGAWLRSFAPSHEAKIGTVGYALWVWSSDEVSE